MISILYNSNVAQARPLADEMAAWIEQRGRQAHICPACDAVSAPDWRETKLVVTLGGDGSILRAARAAAPYDVPILGINLGRVGFLTETEPEAWQSVMSQALAGDYWVEERMMLQASARRNGKQLVEQTDALNDVVIGRGARARVVHLHTEIDGDHMATYVADGLIVATSTGSTAYALAAGGPVLPPQLRNILLVPIAPHLSMARPVVLSEGVAVRIVVTGGRPAMLTVDGEMQAELQSGDQVQVEASPHVARFARVRDENYFYKTLVARLAPRKQTSNSELET